MLACGPPEVPPVNDLSLLLLAGFASSWEMWVILLIILILFGSRLPGIARSLGQGINEFKRGLNDAPPEAPKREAEASKPEAAKSRADEPKA